MSQRGYHNPDVHNPSIYFSNHLSRVESLFDSSRTRSELSHAENQLVKGQAYHLKRGRPKKDRGMHVYPETIDAMRTSKLECSVRDSSESGEDRSKMSAAKSLIKRHFDTRMGEISRLVVNYKNRDGSHREGWANVHSHHNVKRSKDAELEDSESIAINALLNLSRGGM